MFKNGLEVDKEKIDNIGKVQPLSLVKGIQFFLRFMGFYRNFIQDFSKISKPLCNLLKIDNPYCFDVACLHAFLELKKNIVSAPIIVAPDWCSLFELMCDASDMVVGAILGQQRDKVFHSIYYASRTLQ